MRLIEIKWNRNLNNGDISISVCVKNFLPTCFSSFCSALHFHHIYPIIIIIVVVAVVQSNVKESCSFRCVFIQSFKRKSFFIITDFPPSTLSRSLPLTLPHLFYSTVFYFDAIYLIISRLFIDHLRISIQFLLRWINLYVWSYEVTRQVLSEHFSRCFLPPAPNSIFDPLGCVKRSESTSCRCACAYIYLYILFHFILQMMQL